MGGILLHNQNDTALINCTATANGSLATTPSAATSARAALSGTTNTKRTTIHRGMQALPHDVQGHGGGVAYLAVDTSAQGVHIVNESEVQ